MRNFDQVSITKAVLERVANAPDPRVRQISEFFKQFSHHPSVPAKMLCWNPIGGQDSGIASGNSWNAHKPPFVNPAWCQPARR